MIRKAEFSDVPAMLEIGRRFHSATLYATYGATFSPEKLGESLSNYLSSSDACVLVAEKNGALVGVACAVKTQLYMSDDDVAVELFWWVEPEARGGTLAIRLMNHLEQWATQAGCKCMAMSSMATIEGSPADDIYSRRGYRNIEKSWIKGL